MTNKNEKKKNNKKVSLEHFSVLLNIFLVLEIKTVSGNLCLFYTLLILKVGIKYLSIKKYDFLNLYILTI